MNGVSPDRGGLTTRCSRLLPRCARSQRLSSVPLAATATALRGVRKTRSAMRIRQSRGSRQAREQAMTLGRRGAKPRAGRERSFWRQDAATKPRTARSKQGRDKRRAAASGSFNDNRRQDAASTTARVSPARKHRMAHGRARATDGAILQRGVARSLRFLRRRRRRWRKKRAIRRSNKSTISAATSTTAEAISSKMRCRMVHPEFFTSLSMRRVSRDARLLYICSWTVADDYGVLPFDCDLLRAVCFLSDSDVSSEDVAAMIDALERENCYQRFSADGRDWLHICQWSRWQRVDRPSRRRNPTPPPRDEDSTRTRRGLAPKRKERRRKRGKGRGRGRGGRGRRERGETNVIQGSAASNGSGKARDRPSASNFKLTQDVVP